LRSDEEIGQALS